MFVIVAFATAADLATYMQRDLSAADTATATLFLDLATASIRAYVGQTITRATTTERLKVTGDRVRLPQRPVTAVSAIANTAGSVVPFTWHAGPQVWLSNPWNIDTPYGTYGTSHYIDVTYTHGLVIAPDDIRAVTLQVAARSLGVSPADAGLQSESIGGYSYSIGAAAAQGVVGFMAGERATLDRYKVPAGPINMAAR